MIVRLKRIAPRQNYTIGRITIDSNRFCDSLEDPDRGLRQNMSLAQIERLKVPGKTAIPKGTYLIDMNTVSPRYSKIAFYQKYCKGRMPRVVGVPGFEGILIHPGNTADDTAGCILVGQNREVGMVLNSIATWCELYQIFRKAADLGEVITLIVE